MFEQMKVIMVHSCKYSKCVGPDMLTTNLLVFDYCTVCSLTKYTIRRCFALYLYLNHNEWFACLDGLCILRGLQCKSKQVC